MIKHIAIALYLLCCVGLSPAYSQVADTISQTSKEKSSFLLIGLGGSYANLMDQGISPLFYEGLGGGSVIGLIEDGQNYYFQSLIRFDFNNLTSQLSGANIKSFRTEAVFDVFINSWTKRNGKITFTPGLSLQYRWLLNSHASFTNNSQNLQNSLKISPSLHSSLTFKFFDRKFTTGNILRLPLINYTVRPIYASAKLPATYNKEEPSWYDYLKGGDLYGWGSYFGLDSQSYLLYHFANSKNALKLDYFWSYDQLKSENPIMESQHSLLLSIIINL